MPIIRKVYSFFIDSIQTFLIAASVFLVIYIFLFRPFQVNGKSMDPNFEDREYVLTNLVGLRFDSPKKGDVIVFKAPTNEDKDFIKRVIGVPGDKVSLHDGEVLLNGKKLNESAYLKPDVKTFPLEFLKEDQEVTVPEDSYFVLGDNRLYSSDSRAWGFVKKEAIIGKSLFVYWPPGRVRIVNNPYTN